MAHSFMIWKKAVIFFACVAKVQLAVVTKPYCCMSLIMTEVRKVVATMFFAISSYREVRWAETFWRMHTQWWLATAAVLSNEIPCKVCAEGLYSANIEVRELLTWNVHICNCKVKHEPKDVFVILSTLQAYIISSKLVIMVHSAHVFIVQYNRLWTLNWNADSIFLFPWYLLLNCWVAIGCLYCDSFIVSK